MAFQTIGFIGLGLIGGSICQKNEIQSAGHQNLCHGTS